MLNFNTVLIAIILALGGCGLWAATDGGQIWTAETARRVAVQESPIDLPRSIAIEDTSLGKTYLGEPQSPILLLDFVFTHCPTVCIAMGAAFRDIQHRLANHPNSSKLRFLSISFDPSDSVDDLKRYLQRFGADTTSWFGARVIEATERAALLNLLGVVAIPSPQEGFVHNAAIYIVVDGKVTEITDFGDTDRTVARILDLLERPT